MRLAKRKRPPLRNIKDERPPEHGARRPHRLASEPVPVRRRRPDSWEPGFLRMAGLPEGRSLSYVVDGVGTYYDATAPSELEYLLEHGGWEEEGLLERAGRAMQALLGSGISLDNDPRRASLGDLLDREALDREAGERERGFVVVVDQPHDDPTVGLALAGPMRFASMLAHAQAEHGQDDILVVMDPAAPCGGAPGHLAKAEGVRIVSEPLTASSILARARQVYTVSAHLGFEAAMAGLPVTCFGVPFYAGWGFTSDRLVTQRRTRKRSVAEVFAASHFVYSRYFEPYRNRPITFEEALDIAVLGAERARENARITLCVGFADWKRGWVREALKAPGYRPMVSSRTAGLAGFERVVGWASRAPATVERACAEAKVPYIRMEDGFLRSIGLGASLRTGASYVLDRTGMYYDASRPSDLETLLEGGAFDEALLRRARRLREAIVGAGLSKYNVGSAPMPPLPKGKPVILVAGQVASDASIQLGGCTVQGNLGLIRAAREAHPEAVIVYKPHPDVEAGLRPGRVPAKSIERYCDLVIHDVSAPVAIEAADRVVVATSLIGFEALLREKPVTTYGLPFYAGWGLTTDPGSPRRTRRLTLDELVAGALILYPRYIDPVTGLPCTPETIAGRLADGDPLLGRRTRSVKALLKEAWSTAFRRAGRRA